MSQDKKELKNLFNRIGGAMLVFLAAYTLFCGSAAVLSENVTQITYSTDAYVWTELLNAIAYIAAFSIPIWFFLAISKRKTVEPFGLSLTIGEKNTGLLTTAMMFLGTATCFAASYVNSILFPISEEAAEIYFSSDIRGEYVLVLMFISTAIVPAFVEELLFRGMVLSSVLPYSEGGAILVSALLFGLMHQTPFQFFYATAIGVVLGIIRVKTGSIWVGVLVHFCNNFLSVVQTYLLGCYDTYTGNVIYTIITLSVILLALVLGIILYTKTKKRHGIKTVDQIGFYGKHQDASQIFPLNSEEREVYKAFFSPTMILFIIFCGLTMLSTANMIGGV